MSRRRGRRQLRPEAIREIQEAARVVVERERPPVPVTLPRRLVDWSRYPFQRRAFETLMRQRFAGFPWLASAWADYIELQFAREASSLASKKWPAPGAAARVRELGQRAKSAEERARVAEYVLAYYETLFPFLVEFRDDDAPDELVTDGIEDSAADGDVADQAARWLTSDEYRRLPDVQKYQLALDRYWSKRKTRWEVGRDYERFIGHKYEIAGCAVHYQGIIEGFADFGRDLIATRENETSIVQCKYWSAQRTIHEKHVFQLLGTALAYRIEHPHESVTAVFVTSTVLSERAREFAQQLNAILPFVVRECEPFEQYPCIKCNVSRRSGEKIYHLPFDQQYDAVLVEEERLERYVSSVAEADSLGFRRAKKWLGSVQAR